MKAKLEFELPEEEQDLKRSLEAVEYKSALDDVYNKCRNVVKYKEDPSEDLFNFCEEIMRDIGEYTW